MYVPETFRTEDQALLERFVRRHGFATLVTTRGGEPFATHLPLLLEARDGGRRLLGHLARGNPHWRALDGAGPSLAVFHGPHGYVSPSWYEHAPAVPTWNYAVVHAYGRARAIDDAQWLGRLLDRLVETYESGRPEPWPGELPAEFRARMIAGVVGIELEVQRMEGKFKLSQNRPLADRAGVVRHLEADGDAGARELAALMRRHPGVLGEAPAGGGSGAA